VTRGRFTLAALLAAATIGSGAATLAATTPQSNQYLAFVRGSATSLPSVWIADADGSDAHRLAAGDLGLLSPDGADVAVQTMASHGDALEIYSSAGKPLGGFIDAAHDNATPLAWSPDSRYLAVSLANTSPSGGGSLALIDTTTMKERIIASGVIYGASFNPAGTQVVFGKASSQKASAAANLYSAGVSSGGAGQLTTDGDSLNPVWTRAGIVFDRSTARGISRAPIYQLWLYASGKTKQLTHLSVAPLLDGLVPLAASQNGNRLIAEYTGEDTSYAWTIQLSPLTVKPLSVTGESTDSEHVQGYEIAPAGNRLLIDVGGFEGPADNGEVESVAFGAGTPTRLTRGAEPSWSG
jgi:hypothetical protein